MSELLVPDAQDAVISKPAVSAAWRPRHIRRWLAPVVGIVCATGAYLLLDGGFLGPVGSFGILLLLLLAMPSARRVSSRVAVNGALFMALASALWWSVWPVGWNRTALMIALTVGVMGWVAAGSSDRRGVVRRLVPETNSSDVLLVPAAAAAAWAMSDWLFASSPWRALVTILPGADNWVHLDIATTMRAHGGRLSTIDLPPVGGSWRNGGYPAGFHSLVDSLSELTAPRIPTGAQSLTAYAHGVGMLVVLGTLVLIGSLLSLVGERARLEVTAPAVALVCSAFLWEPGQKLFADGFAGFWLGCLAATAALLLSVEVRTHAGWTCPAAVLALLTVVVLCWPPLLLLGGPALLFVAYGTLQRRSWRFLRLSGRKALFAALVVVLALGVVAYAGVVPRVGLRELITAEGGITGTSPTATFVLLVAATIVCFFLPRWVTATGRASDDNVQMARGVRLLGLVPLAAMLTIAVFLWIEFTINGGTAYYFLKYMIGVKLVMAGVAVGAFAVAATLLLRHRRSTPRDGVLGLVAFVLATQAFSPFPGGAVGLQAHPGGTAGLAPPYDVQAVASGVLSAAGNSTPRQSLDREYVAMGEGRAAQAFYPDAWYHALFATTTTDVSARLDLLRRPIRGPQQAVPVIESILRASPTVEIVVAPRWIAEVRAGLGSPDLSSRVVTWNPR